MFQNIYIKRIFIITFETVEKIELFCDVYNSETLLNNVHQK